MPAKRISWPALHAGTLAVGLSMLSASTIAAEVPYAIEWSAQIGTAAGDFSGSVTVDAAGNLYIGGSTFGSLGGTNAGNLDAFMTKFDASGNVLWSRQIGTTSLDDGSSVVVDGSGNVYIAGRTGGDLGGSSAGFIDTFLMKYDASGNQMWSRQIGTTENDGGRGLAVDGSGYVYISGVTGGGFGGPNAGMDDDAYLVKFDALGNQLWIQQIGTTEDDDSRAVAVDGSGNIYISGTTDGSLAGTNAGSNDAFLTKFDASGNQLWSRQIGTPGNDQGRSVAVDSAGNAYISGVAGGSLGGPSAGSSDAYLAKFDPSGNQLWSRQIGTISDDRSHSVAVDGAGNVFIGGLTFGDLGGTNAGSPDAFLSKFDPTGNLLWTQQFGTDGWDESGELVVDGAGNVYISGSTEGSLFGPNAGDFDAFIVKFAVPEPASVSLLALGGLALLRRGR